MSLHPHAHLKDGPPMRRASLSNYDRPQRSMRSHSVSATDHTAAAVAAAVAAADLGAASLPVSFLQSHHAHLHNADQWLAHNLSFRDTDIEADYKSYQLQILTPRLWAMSKVAILISLLLTAADLYHMTWSTLPVRFATVFFVSISLFLTKPREDETNRTWVAAIFFTTGTFIVISLTRILRDKEAPEFHAITFAVLFLYIFRVRLMDSLKTLLPGLLLFIGTTFIYSDYEIALLTVLPVIFITALITPCVYIIEKHDRQGFYLNTLMEQHHEELVEEKKKTEKLLNNIYPKHIADRMQAKLQNAFDSAATDGPGSVDDIDLSEFAVYYPTCSVLFADVVSFTTISSGLNPADLVSLLNQMFSAFDYIALRYKLEKIKTIGDAYMVAGGIPHPHPKAHAYVVHMGLNMIHTINQLKATNPQFKDFSVRIGISTGSAHSGIVGKAKRTFELFGDAVKVAHLMEYSGESMRVHVSQSTYDATQDLFLFTPRDVTSIEGYSHEKTYFVLDKKGREEFTRSPEKQSEVLVTSHDVPANPKPENPDLQIIVVPKLDKNVASFRGSIDSTVNNNGKRRSQARIAAELMTDIVYDKYRSPWKISFEDEHLEQEYWNEFWSDSWNERVARFHSLGMVAFYFLWLGLETYATGFVWEIFVFRCVSIVVVCIQGFSTVSESFVGDQLVEKINMLGFLLLHLLMIAKCIFVARSTSYESMSNVSFSPYYFFAEYTFLNAFTHMSPRTRFTVVFFFTSAMCAIHIILYACLYSSFTRGIYSSFSEALSHFAVVAIVTICASWSQEYIMRATYVAKRLNNRIAEELADNQTRAEVLILSILPEAIYQKLKTTGNVEPESFADVTVMFIDIFDFHGLTDPLSTTQKIEILSELFSILDKMVAAYQLEKIKTISDAYMVVGGLSAEVVNHLERTALMALEVQKKLKKKQFPYLQGPLSVKIGVHVGPIVGGVVGITKYIYDVWGDAVNIASRMESSGVCGEIQVSEAVFNRLSDKFLFDARGQVMIKGKGQMNTYLLRGVGAEIPGRAPSALSAVSV